MSSYTISKKLNPNKVFILQKSEINKRFDPLFYVPELLDLEKRILSKKPSKLRNFVKSISSGATPRRDEEDKYYSTPENGIPFLRVQNITQYGLDLSDVKYINTETHNSLLKRSQVEEDDLLVTITGRIASSAVAPKGFIGNINQHSVVIKTHNRETSEMLACYLNTSIGQKLANRLATGGTRLALDYPALLSIPIIVNDKILAITKKVILEKKENEEKSKNLLNSIDTYLLKELGITLPEKEENTLKSRMFTASISELSGTRFDPYFNKAYFKNVQSAFENCSVDFSNIKSTLQYIKTGTTPHQKLNPFTENKEIVFLRNTNLKKYRIDLENTKYVKTEFNKELTYSLKGEVIMCIAGTVGLSAINDINEPISINQNVSALKFYENVINPNFASYWFNTSIFIELTKRACSVATIHYLNNDNLKLLPIPIPPLEKQLEIAEHISAIRKQAQDLKDQTKLLLEKANKEIEDILLNT